ncbi:TRAP transporter substrate-binding protein [uncultured Thiodictyon sp.]|uniref:TRAP transporter substrate-binding protein n=1 Tax=uncultured Thiodictyon sp. TaxID=1846217 RepID=UPI0025F53E45|nr:TRAP transporter substrate-binding protein [uncultured Thiodictyon sp.]
MKPGSIVIGLLCLLCTLAVQADEPIVIKFSHVVAADTPKGKAAERFAQLAKEKTKGRVEVSVYPNSTLAGDKDEMQNLQLGAVQMLAPSLAKFGPLGVKEFEVFDLPYLFDDYDQLHRVTQGPVGQALLAKLADKGVLGLAFWDNGFKVMSANKPLHEVKDFRGQKMRIQSSKVLEAQMRALGADPQVIPFGEVYQALQTGVVDGTENPPSNLYTQKMYEVQKFVTDSNHGYLGYAVIVNKAFWDGLPADIRSALEEAMAEATVYANEIAKQENVEALAKVKASGKSEIIALTPEQKTAWKKALAPVHRKMEARVGKGLIQSIYQATGSDISKL